MTESGITFTDPADLAEFIYVIASKGATYVTETFTDDNGKTLYRVELTGGF
jgi:hypothetical protein